MATWQACLLSNKRGRSGEWGSESGEDFSFSVCNTAGLTHSQFIDIKHIRYSTLNNVLSNQARQAFEIVR